MPKFQDHKLTTDLCRYCLMCRHTCPVHHVVRLESTSPHGWGLLIASVERQLIDWNEDSVDVLYQCADCGSCQAHCVTDQPLPLAINASRASVVALNLAPAIVYSLQQKLREWSNPYADQRPEEVSGTGEAALVVGAAGRYLQPETVAAARQLLQAAGVEVVPVAVGRESAYLANTLGLPAEARALGQATLDEIQQTGARRLFVLSPEDVYTYQTLFPALGLAWPEGVEVIEVSQFLADQVEAGRLSFSPVELAAYAFYDPDHTVRVPGRWDAPRRLLAALTDTPPVELFWRKERSAASGASGGLYFTQPGLSRTLAHARLAEAEERGVKTLLTDAPHALYHLRQQAEDPKNGFTVEVKGLLELLAAHLFSPR